MADKNLVAPDRLAIPIASEGDYNIIPTNSQDKASLEQGFPVKTSIPFNQGGDPVSRNDMNGFFKPSFQAFILVSERWSSDL